MKGKLIAQGTGMPGMLNLCYKSGLTSENSILEVTNYERGDWELYERVTDRKE